MDPAPESVSPKGSDPPVSVNVYGANPPPPVRVWLYPMPDVPFGSDGGESVRVLQLNESVYDCTPVHP